MVDWLLHLDRRKVFNCFSSQNRIIIFALYRSVVMLPFSSYFPSVFTFDSFLFLLFAFFLLHPYFLLPSLLSFSTFFTFSFFSSTLSTSFRFFPSISPSFFPLYSVFLLNFSYSFQRKLTPCQGVSCSSLFFYSFSIPLFMSLLTLCKSRLRPCVGFLHPLPALWPPHTAPPEYCVYLEPPKHPRRRLPRHSPVCLCPPQVSTHEYLPSLVGLAGAPQPLVRRFSQDIQSLLTLLHRRDTPRAPLIYEAPLRFLIGIVADQ